MLLPRFVASWLLVAGVLVAQVGTPPTGKQLDDLRLSAYAAENQQRFADAAETFLKLGAAEPMRVEWVVAAGRCLGRGGRFADATKLLAEARSRFQGETSIAAMLARTFLLQAETDRAVMHPEVLWADAAELAESVLATDPNHEDCRLVLAQVRYLQGDEAAAVAAAEEAVQRHPARAGAHVLLGRIHGDRFRALLTEYETTRPEGQPAADLVGRIDTFRQLALRSYTTAAKLDPSRPHPHVMLGQLRWIDKKPDQARAHYADALVLDPDVRIAHDELVAALSIPDRVAFYDAVRRRYEAGKDPQPAKVATLLFHAGRAWFEGAAWREAMEACRRAVQLNPAAANAHWYTFLAAYELGEHDIAEEHAAAYAAAGAAAFADVIRDLHGDRRGATGAIVEFLGNRAFAAKRLDRSRDLNHVVACLKDSADAWNNHAFLCRETGQFQAAWESYLHALEKEPDSPQLLNDGAVVLQYHLPTPEHLAKARTMYERAIQRADLLLADARTTEATRKTAAEAKANAQKNLQELGR
ncbi:MAG: tetratricopeptide repeat protein [Planctomycetes bacterium]|nr:tetratricopeptide repeat protein [Planctomycetota bacterium]